MTTIEDTIWCSPLGMVQVYDAWNTADQPVRRQFCPDCGASVEAHTVNEASYVPAHPVRPVVLDEIDFLAYAEDEIALQGRTCTDCDAVGHTAVTCPYGDNAYGTIDYWAMLDEMDKF